MFNGRLHHVGIIVQSEEHAEKLASLFGLTLGRRQFVPEYEADCIFTAGEHGVVEFVVPRGGKLANFNKGMGGLHHIAIEVADMNTVNDELANAGVRLLESNAVDAGPILINFLPPIYTRGVIVEYIQPKSQLHDV